MRHLDLAPDHEAARLRDQPGGSDQESPELLAAIDQGLRSLHEKGARVMGCDELEAKVRQWAGGRTAA